MGRDPGDRSKVEVFRRGSYVFFLEKGDSKFRGCPLSLVSHVFWVNVYTSRFPIDTGLGHRRFDKGRDRGWFPSLTLDNGLESWTFFLGPQYISTVNFFTGFLWWSVPLGCSTLYMRVVCKAGVRGSEDDSRGNRFELNFRLPIP